MTLSVKVSGAWKEVTNVSVRVGGAWKAVTGVFVKVSGAWKEVTMLPDSVTASADWGANSGAAPGTITSAARTMTVPSGNPGSLNLGLSGDYDGTPQYQINAGTWTTFADGADISVSNGNTLAFRCLNMVTATTMAVAVTDNTTAAAVGGWSGSGL